MKKEHNLFNEQFSFSIKDKDGRESNKYRSIYAGSRTKPECTDNSLYPDPSMFCEFLFSAMPSFYSNKSCLRSSRDRNK